ncbi:MAG: hypothetical protein ACKOOI_03870, partial [Pirellula sp.]
DLLGGLVKFLAAGCGLNEGSPLANNVDDFSEIIYERQSTARIDSMTSRSLQVIDVQMRCGLLRLDPRRDLLGGLVKFLAAGCGLNESSPLANSVDDFSEIIYEH